MTQSSLKKRRKGRLVAGIRYGYSVIDRKTFYTIHSASSGMLGHGKILGIAVDEERAIEMMRQQQEWGN